MWSSFGSRPYDDGLLWSSEGPISVRRTEGCIGWTRTRALPDMSGDRRLSAGAGRSPDAMEPAKFEYQAICLSAASVSTGRPTWLVGTKLDTPSDEERRAERDREQPERVRLRDIGRQQVRECVAVDRISIFERPVHRVADIERKNRCITGQNRIVRRIQRRHHH